MGLIPPRRTRKAKLSSSTKGGICPKGNKQKGKGKVGHGNVTRNYAIPKDFAGKNNPSYVLVRGDDGYTFARFVGTNYDDYAWPYLCS